MYRMKWLNWLILQLRTAWKLAKSGKCHSGESSTHIYGATTSCWMLTSCWCQSRLLLLHMRLAQSESNRCHLSLQSQNCKVILQIKRTFVVVVVVVIESPRNIQEWAFKFIPTKQNQKNSMYIVIRIKIRIKMGFFFNLLNLWYFFSLSPLKILVIPIKDKQMGFDPPGQILYS